MLQFMKNTDLKNMHLDRQAYYCSNNISLHCRE